MQAILKTLQASHKNKKKRFKFIKGDICNSELVEYIFQEYDVDGVINFAAESHVDSPYMTHRYF